MAPYKGRSENLPVIHEYSLIKFNKPYAELSAAQQLNVRRAACKDPRYVKKVKHKQKNTSTFIDANQGKLPQKTQPVSHQ